MIDFIKCEVLGVNINDLQLKKTLDFSGKYHLSGEVETKRVYAKYKEMLITIHDDRRVFLQGSLPIMAYGNNYVNLKFDDFINVVKELESLFGVDAKMFLLQNFEYGFSVNLGGINPTDFLKGELIDFKGEIGSVDTYKKNGYGIQYHKTQYHLKLYDKTAQYSLNENLLRIEQRIKRMVYAKKKYRITSLGGLTNANIWYELKKDLQSIISELVICSIDKINWENTPPKDLREIVTWKNPEFWRMNRPNSKEFEMGSKDDYYLKRRRIYYEFKGQFIQLIKKYRLNATQINILEQVDIEFRNVMPNLTSMEEYEMGIFPRKMKYSPMDLMRKK